MNNSETIIRGKESIITKGLAARKANSYAGGIFYIFEGTDDKKSTNIEGMTKNETLVDPLYAADVYYHELDHMQTHASDGQSAHASYKGNVVVTFCVDGINGMPLVQKLMKDTKNNVVVASTTIDNAQQNSNGKRRLSEKYIITNIVLKKYSARNTNGIKMIAVEIIGTYCTYKKIIDHINGENKGNVVYTITDNRPSK